MRSIINLSETMPLKPNYKLLVVDADQDVIHVLQCALGKAGYDVEAISESERVLTNIIKSDPDLILLDLAMPLVDTIEIGRQIKQHPLLPRVLLVFTTDEPTEETEVAAFEAGADGYVTKPIRTRALLGRVHALLARRDYQSDEKTSSISLGGLVINKLSYTVYKEGTSIPVARKEFELLFFLALHPNRLYTREELIGEIWGNNIYVLERTIDVHIRRLREKIGDDYIKTVKGIGYRLEWNPNVAS